MPILDNPRHERFAQFIADGKSATKAYELAGYRSSRQNAQRLTTNDDVRARVAELQQQAAAKHEITRDRITQMLLKDWEAAHDNKQIGAARAASESLGRLHGLYIEKRQDDVTVRDISDQPMTADGWEKQYCGGAGTH